MDNRPCFVDDIVNIDVVPVTNNASNIINLLLDLGF